MPHDARVPFLKGEYMKKRVLAIAAIVILAGLYVACLVLALIHSDAAFKLLQLTLVMTVLVPVTAYVAMMFYKFLDFMLKYHKLCVILFRDNYSF